MYGDFFTLVRPNGSTRVFRLTSKGLYESQFLESKKGAAIITTVKDNENSSTKRDVKRATQAGRIMEIIGRPSEQHMREIVGIKQLLNCEVSEQDV